MAANISEALTAVITSDLESTITMAVPGISTAGHLVAPQLRSAEADPLFAFCLSPCKMHIVAFWTFQDLALVLDELHMLLVLLALRASLVFLDRLLIIQSSHFRTSDA
jgi:hypothetical protein